ncbi:DUF6262 family protein [Lysinibacillus sp. OL1_EC]|uniref:Transposase n=1 Tax=Lysinibacillus boronitolerans JCM 21713 = 10a = NBRC 103108 TaxID=1294264 RepID=A0ABR4Y5F1_9BACI|nr:MULTISPECIES: DUF6262 family protein [Lysinibacillus]MDC6267296.1 DUF6262 family protein [Lysinibacillus sphaericus]KGR89426.1 transposase [Lysinibacillus boronitolerans JCM 21713 = 10a = NBRC 103108]MCM0627431.1 DUF6262 family protein [Lysinibacillus sp. OL1_EC]MDN4968270.1 DUF6262 family protein [Lysinibacillus fusiformis]MDN4968444.1 DUF6262 family protein [Lysinibacillus fusiformis]
MVNNNPNIEGLLSHALEKKLQAKEKVETAIKKMLKEKININFNSVSHVANVSKTFLYKEQTIRNRIDYLRKQQEGLSSVKSYKRNVSETSKDVIIKALKNKIENLNGKIATLEQEKEQLQIQLKKDLGKVYENI